MNGSDRWRITHSRAAIDRRIDALVYKLSGLTADGIALVEGDA